MLPDFYQHLGPEERKRSLTTGEAVVFFVFIAILIGVAVWLRFGCEDSKAKPAVAAQPVITQAPLLRAPLK